MWLLAGVATEAFLKGAVGEKHITRTLLASVALLSHLADPTENRVSLIRTSYIGPLKALGNQEHAGLSFTGPP